MIKIYPTDPGNSKQWTVEIDFSENGIPTELHVSPDWKEALRTINDFLNEEMKL